MPIGDKHFRIPMNRPRKRLTGKRLDSYVEWHAKYDDLNVGWEIDIFENFDDCGRGAGDLFVFREESDYTALPHYPPHPPPLREIIPFGHGHHDPLVDLGALLPAKEVLLLIKEEEELNACKGKRARHVKPLPDRPAKQARTG